MPQDHHKKGIGHTALHWSAAGGHVMAIDWLLENGASVKSLNSNDSTPLHSAAGSGHLVAVQRLVDAGADPKAIDDDDMTAASLAASRGHANVASVLKG